MSVLLEMEEVAQTFAHADAKKTVAQLVSDGGIRPLDVGPLANSRHLEGFGLFHMTLQEQVNGNWATSLKIVG